MANSSYQVPSSPKLLAIKSRNLGIFQKPGAALPSRYPSWRLELVVEQVCSGGNITMYYVDLMDTQVHVYSYDGKFIGNYVFSRNY